MTLTRNIQLMAAEVAQHLESEAVIQGIYWDNKNQRGRFIGCLGHNSDPAVAVERFGLTEPLLRVAENIFEGLPADEATGFFAAFPAAVGCDGRDLSLVHWQFLAAELRALPPVTVDVQAVIDPVIVGMDLLASGQEWLAGWAASRAARAAAWAATRAAAWAAAEAAAWAAARAADAARPDRLSVRRRQRDLLLDLIRKAPVVEVQS